MARLDSAVVRGFAGTARGSGRKLPARALAPWLGLSPIIVSMLMYVVSYHSHQSNHSSATHQYGSDLIPERSLVAPSTKKLIKTVNKHMVQMITFPNRARMAAYL
jgi:hypothetical protein